MKKTVILLIIIIAIAAFLRLWDIKNIPPGLYPDEAMNGNNALEALSKCRNFEMLKCLSGFKVFYPENNGREGLFINIQALSIRLFGNEPWALRLPSAIFGILTVLGVYFLSRELFSGNKNIALLAAFLTATSFWHINFSRIGFRAIMAPAFLVWALFLLLKALNQTKNNFQLSIIGGVLYGLGFYSYISYRITPILILVILFFYWLKNKEQNLRKKIIISAFYFLFSALIIALPLGIYFLKHPQDFFGRTSQISVSSASSPIETLGGNILKTIGMFWVHGDYNWRHNFSGEPQLWPPAGILFLLGLVIGIKNLVNIKRKGALAEILLFGWIILGLAPMALSNEGVPHALRALIAIPPVMIFAAIGLEWIINLIRRWLEIQKEKRPQFLQKIKRVEKELTVLLFLFLLAISVNAYNQYFLRWAPNPNVYFAFNQNYVEIGNYLNTLPEKLPKYVIINANGVLVRGIPMPSQTIMFITKTWLPEWQKEKNIYYITSENLDKFFGEINGEENFAITILEADPAISKKLRDGIPGLKFKNENGIAVGTL